jgi:hypothetical protein
MAAKPEPQLPVLGESPAPAATALAGQQQPAAPPGEPNPFLLGDGEVARQQGASVGDLLVLDMLLEQPPSSPAAAAKGRGDAPPSKRDSPQFPDINPFHHPSPVARSSASGSLPGYANPFLPPPPPMPPPMPPPRAGAGRARGAASPATPQPQAQAQPTVQPPGEQRYSLESSPALSPLVRASEAITHAALHPAEPVTGPSPRPSSSGASGAAAAAPAGGGSAQGAQGAQDPSLGDLYYSREATIADVIERQRASGRPGAAGAAAAAGVVLPCSSGGR